MDSTPLTEGTLLWEPSENLLREANISRYLRFLNDARRLSFGAYADLWTWSVTELEDFWSSIWDFYGVIASAPYSNILSERKMPGSVWFPGAKLNYTENVFRWARPDGPALKFQSEITPLTEISWEELGCKVASIVTALRDFGVGKGDRVVAYLPNIPETIIAFLACASVGAIWSSCSPDFGFRSVTDRFRQIEPKVLFAVDGYQYGGKKFDCRPTIATLQDSLPTLKRTVLVPYLYPTESPGGLDKVLVWNDLIRQRGTLTYEQVDFNHPLWVVYSSGTTGLPKPLVHSQGGILIEFLKFNGLHVDVRPGDSFFWFSTTGWVMWNIMQGGLLLGSTSVLYDGSPGYPDMSVLWDLAEKAKLTAFGASAAYITACMNQGLVPGESRDLSALRVVGSTGSPLSPAGFKWVYDNVKDDVLLASVSGGTDPCTGFLGSCPLLPVRAGELQCRCLGVKAESYDENGRSMFDQVGELVITEPMPSMPLYLWNDPDYRRYIESYFDVFPGVWRHGDWVKITSRGSAVITGRSDSTLKRMGVRMGSSEIYGVVDELPEVLESLVVGFENAKGNYIMPLFVVVRDDVVFDDVLRDKIKDAIRKSLSPRHVPDEIHSVPSIPKTLNGKRLEIPVKKILSGSPLEQSVNVDSMSNPESLKYFQDLAKVMNA
ncbi:MAG TPA: acetoacetate--CoA ligase [Desulfomonilaceae bacterium]|nr:acetoacetate--CoA ligase [Desulfomonilaceae bacterium]